MYDMDIEIFDASNVGLKWLEKYKPIWVDLVIRLVRATNGEMETL